MRQPNVTGRSLLHTLNGLEMSLAKPRVLNRHCARRSNSWTRCIATWTVRRSRMQRSTSAISTSSGQTGSRLLSKYRRDSTSKKQRRWWSYSRKWPTNWHSCANRAILSEASLWLPNQLEKNYELNWLRLKSRPRRLLREWRAVSDNMKQ